MLSPIENAPAVPLDRIAPITFVFWIMKICATTAGETGGDMLSMTLKFGHEFSSLALLALFLLTLAAQLRSDRFRPGLFWLTVLMASTAATPIADFIVERLDPRFTTAPPLTALLLMAVLGAWYRSAGVIDVSAITDGRTEGFFWLTLFLCNMLGALLGDYLTDGSGLGYGESNLLISILLGSLAFGYFCTDLPRACLFWTAFILTRPFGTTMGDYLSKDSAQGGLALGTIGASALLLTTLAALVLASIWIGPPGNPD